VLGQRRDILAAATGESPPRVVQSGQLGRARRPPLQHGTHDTECVQTKKNSGSVRKVI